MQEQVQTTTGQFAQAIVRNLDKHPCGKICGLLPRIQLKNSEFPSCQQPFCFDSLCNSLFISEYLKNILFRNLAGSSFR
jgi:hypothetical protein